ncbi:hypothetical protein MHU86_5351 [Fragilaria crotonensis]|nr:hypothetical protein MHU86_15611 [Fragilaria crotonensis]KAI2509103.1 hypothetical protein MHU86_5351 [Fragilaria crotonensis]
MSTNSASSLTSLSQSTKRARRSSKQASACKLQAKRSKLLDYDIRYEAAFKEATNLVTAGTGKPVHAICKRLNQLFNLDGTERLARSTVYNATKSGLIGVSPMKKGPEPKIPDKFLEVVATHAQVCQAAGDGELKGKDLKRLIGASMIGTHSTCRCIQG